MPIMGGISNVARNLKGMVGVNNVARKINKGFYGDENGVARLVYTAFDPTLEDKSLSQNTTSGRNRSVILCTKDWLQSAFNAGYRTFNALLTLNVTDTDFAIDLGLTNSESASSISDIYKLIGTSRGTFSKTLSVSLSDIVSMLNDNLYFNMVVTRNSIVRATGTITNIYMS